MQTPPLPRSADTLNEDALRALKNMQNTFGTYRIQKLEADEFFPLSVRVMTVSLDKYRRAQGTPIALCQTLFPGKHIDSVLSFLEHEANNSMSSAKGLDPRVQGKKHRQRMQALQNDYCMLKDLMAFLTSLRRPSYDPWKPPF